MLKLEALPVDGHSIFAIGPSDEELAVDGASFDQIDHHLGLLRKQGFLDCPGEPMLSGKFPFRGLTALFWLLFAQLDQRTALPLGGSGRAAPKEEVRVWIPTGTSTRSSRRVDKRRGVMARQ